MKHYCPHSTDEEAEVEWSEITYKRQEGTSLEAQWLRFCFSMAGGGGAGVGSTLGSGTKIPLAMWYSRKEKQANKKKKAAAGDLGSDAYVLRAQVKHFASRPML